VKTIVFWGRPDAPPADGRSYVRWRDECAALRDEADEAAMAWTKSVGRRSWRDGRSLRDLLVWRDIPLWWFAELYLYHSTSAPGRVRIIETCARVLERERPDEVEAAFLSAEETLLLARTCSAMGVLHHGRPPVPSAASPWRASWRSRLNTAKTVLTVVKAALAGRPDPPPADPRRRTVLFLSHAAFWKERLDPETSASRPYEHYFDRLIPELEREPGWRAAVLALGPRAPFRRRGRGDQVRDWLSLRPDAGPFVHVDRLASAGVLREVWRGTRHLRGLWRSLRRSGARPEAFSHRGASFSDLSHGDLAATLLLQLPWAIRSVAEMREALAFFQPQAACLYAESSGWGRAALLACRAAGVPTVAIQHGIVYPKYFSYRHDPDEAGCPRPDRTAVFGEAARRLLATLGGYPPDRLVTTGSPRFDDLLRAANEWDRGAVRRGLGVADGERLVVIASRFRAIRDTHHSIGGAFASLVRAIEARPDTRAVVKPHPAESADPYAAVLRESGARRIALVDPRLDLMHLLHAADALVTVESLSAVEALVLGRPVLVLEMPTHLSDLVEAGVALGVPAGADPGPALDGALSPGPVREGLDRARGSYLSELAMGVDGGATGRIVALLRDTAAGPAMVGSRALP
jgi:hypothetical protein